MRAFMSSPGNVILIIAIIVASASGLWSAWQPDLPAIGVSSAVDHMVTVTLAEAASAVGVIASIMHVVLPKMIAVDNSPKPS